MQNVKELTVQEMQKTIGGDDVNCAINTVGGALTGGFGGGVVGFFGSCVRWGYNKKPQHGWH
ncbi:Blp family class II bacteriocin [Enterococcus sp. CSURQ0835]|uniref:Blp family class II bacteriocin n=1 Tax=Enterococcus sp. CSURQ0835 TaxID=2681394 RepID=UPI001358BEDE|nr:Blp family class II bacteriocin [Enterococcus sp. CSURQ0835]